MKKVLTVTLALVALAALTGFVTAPQGWFVAIEENAMTTRCGGVNNIPVAGATDCPTAQVAAWNLLSTLLSTPNCMNSGCPAGYTISQGVSTCRFDPYTRPNGSTAKRWQVGWTWTCTPPPPCCNYHLDLSTGQGGPQDTLWKMNGNPAYVTPVYPGWMTLPGAKWIQPVSAPTPSHNVPPGTYKYTVKFEIPKCAANNEVRLVGKFGADNSAKAFLDSPGNPVGSCNGPNCFNPSGGQAPVSLTVPSNLLSPGWHTLEIDVTNISGPSGLVVNAQLDRQCK